MTTSLRDAAARLRVELELGVITTRDVISWADQMIAELPKAPEPLLELSAAVTSNPHEVRSKLNQLAADASVVDALRKALGRMHDELVNHPNLLPTFARGLAQLAAELGYELPDDLIGIVGFDDQYDHAKHGIYGTEEWVRQNLLAFTRPFRDEAR